MRRDTGLPLTQLFRLHDGSLYCRRAATKPVHISGVFSGKKAHGERAVRIKQFCIRVVLVRMLFI